MKMSTVLSQNRQEVNSTELSSPIASRRGVRSATTESAGSSNTIVANDVNSLKIREDKLLTKEMLTQIRKQFPKHLFTSHSVLERGANTFAEFKTPRTPVLQQTKLNSAVILNNLNQSYALGMSTFKVLARSCDSFDRWVHVRWCENFPCFGVHLRVNTSVQRAKQTTADALLSQIESLFFITNTKNDTSVEYERKFFEHRIKFGRCKYPEIDFSNVIPLLNPAEQYRKELKNLYRKHRSFEPLSFANQYVTDSFLTPFEKKTKTFCNKSTFNIKEEEPIINALNGDIAVYQEETAFEQTGETSDSHTGTTMGSDTNLKDQDDSGANQLTLQESGQSALSTQRTEVEGGAKQDGLVMPSNEPNYNDITHIHSQITDKYFKIDTFEWTNTAVLGAIIYEQEILAPFNSTNDLVKNTPPVALMETHAYIKPQVKVKVQIPSSTMMGGNLVVGWKYYCARGTTTTPASRYPTHAYELHQTDSAMISAQAGNTVEFEIPFLGPLDWLPTRNAFAWPAGFYVKLFIGVINPLSIGTGGTPSVKGTIYVSMMNKFGKTQFMGIKQREPVERLPPALEQNDFESAIPMILKCLSNLDRPNDSNDLNQIQVATSCNMSLGSGLKHIKKLHLKAASQIPHPKDSLGSDDQMSVDFLKKIYYPIAHTTLSTSQAVGAYVGFDDGNKRTDFVPCSPRQSFILSGFSGDLPTGNYWVTECPISMLARHATYWSGSLKFKMIVGAAASHECRLRAYFVPNPNNESPSQKLDLSGAYINTVYSIKEQTNFEFTVPYMNFAKLAATADLVDNFVGDPPELSNFGEATGVLVFVIESPLVASNAVSKTVNATLYMACGDDFELSTPRHNRTAFFQPAVETAEEQNGEDTRHKEDTRSQLFPSKKTVIGTLMQEPFSLKDVMRRYAFYVREDVSWTANNDEYDFNLPVTPGPVRDASNRPWDLIDLLYTGFRFFKGSIDYLVEVQGKEVSNQTISVYHHPENCNYLGGLVRMPVVNLPLPTATQPTVEDSITTNNQRNRGSETLTGASRNQYSQIAHERSSTVLSTMINVSTPWISRYNCILTNFELQPYNGGESVLEAGHMAANGTLTVRINRDGSDANSVPAVIRVERCLRDDSHFYSFQGFPKRATYQLAKTWRYPNRDLDAISTSISNVFQSELQALPPKESNQVVIKHLKTLTEEEQKNFLMDLSKAIPKSQNFRRKELSQDAEIVTEQMFSIFKGAADVVFDNKDLVQALVKSLFKGVWKTLKLLLTPAGWSKMRQVKNAVFATTIQFCMADSYQGKLSCFFRMLYDLGFISLSATTMCAGVAMAYWFNRTPAKVYSLSGITPVFEQAFDEPDAIKASMEWVQFFAPLLFAAFSFKSSKDAHFIEKFGLYFKEIFMLGNSVSLFISRNLEFIRKISEYVFNSQNKAAEEMQKCYEMRKDILDWAKEVASITAPGLRATVQSSKRWQMKVLNLTRKADEIMVTVDGIPPKYRTPFTTLYKKIHELNGTFSHGINGVHKPVEPIVLWLNGTPGCGKSKIMDHIAISVMKKCGIVHDGPAIFTRNFVDYWNGYANQPCVKYDDLTFNQSDENLNRILNEIQCLCSIAPFNAPMAAIEDKLMIVNPMLVIIGANSTVIVNNSIGDTTAFHRRRDVLATVGYDLGFLRSKFGEDFTAPNSMADIVTEENKEWFSEAAGYPHLRFFIHRDPVNPGTPQGLGMSYTEFVDHCVTSCAKRWTMRNRMADEANDLQYGLTPERWISGANGELDQHILDQLKEINQQRTENNITWSRESLEIEDEFEDAVEEQCLNWFRKQTQDMYDIPEPSAVFPFHLECTELANLRRRQPTRDKSVDIPKETDFVRAWENRDNQDMWYNLEDYKFSANVNLECRHQIETNTWRYAFHKETNKLVLVGLFKVRNQRLKHAIFGNIFNPEINYLWLYFPLEKHPWCWCTMDDDYIETKLMDSVTYMSKTDRIKLRQNYYRKIFEQTTDDLNVNLIEELFNKIKGYGSVAKTWIMEKWHQWDDVNEGHGVGGLVMLGIILASSISLIVKISRFFSNKTEQQVEEQSDNLEMNAKFLKRVNAGLPLTEELAIYAIRELQFTFEDLEHFGVEQMQHSGGVHNVRATPKAVTIKAIKEQMQHSGGVKSVKAGPKVTTHNVVREQLNEHREAYLDKVLRQNTFKLIAPGQRSGIATVMTALGIKDRAFLIPYHFLMHARNNWATLEVKEISEKEFNVLSRLGVIENKYGNYLPFGRYSFNGKIYNASHETIEVNGVDMIKIKAFSDVDTFIRARYLLQDKEIDITVPYSSLKIYAFQKPDIDLCVCIGPQSMIPRASIIKQIAPDDHNMWDQLGCTMFERVLSNSHAGKDSFCKTVFGNVTSVNKQTYYPNLDGWQTQVNGWTYPREKQGMCGSFLACNKSGLILGIHVCKMNDKGVAVKIPRKAIEEILEAEGLLDFEQQELNPATWSVDGDFVILGSVEQAVHIPNQTSLRKSLVYEEFEPNRFPVQLSSKGDEWCAEKAIKEAITKGFNPPAPVSTTDLQAIEDSLVTYYNAVPAHNVVSCHSLQAAIVGIKDKPYINSLKLNSSLGYPLNVEYPGKTKHHMIKVQRDEKGEILNVATHQRLLAEYEREMSLRRQGIVPAVYYTEFVKDERLKPGKAPRLISGSPVQTTLAWKQYFGDFIDHVQKHRHTYGIAIGINPWGSEWNEMANNLLNVSENIIAGDHKDFGPRLMPEFVWLFGQVVNSWYSKYCEDCEEDNKIRAILVQELVACKRIAHDLKFQTLCGSPSGSLVTALINSFVNQCYMMLSWRKLSEGSPYNSFHYFFKMTKFYFYGDDLIASVADPVLGWFNNVGIQKVLAQYGLAYTDADKTRTEIRSHVTLQEASFLKNTFTRHQTRNIWRSTLDWKVIEDMPCWIHKTSDEKEATEVNLLTALRFAATHDPLTFNTFRERVQTALASIQSTMVTPSYQDIDDDLFERELYIDYTTKQISALSTPLEAKRVNAALNNPLDDDLLEIYEQEKILEVKALGSSETRCGVTPSQLRVKEDRSKIESKGGEVRTNRASNFSP